MDKDKKDVVDFEFEGKNYRVVKPTNKIRRESEPVYAKAYRQAILDGFLLDAEIDDILEERGFTEKDAGRKRNDLAKRIREAEVKLTQEDYTDLDEGKQIAFEVQDLRNNLLNLEGARNQLQSNSVDRQAENKRFNYFAYRCCTDANGNQLWGDFQEFENDDSPLAVKAATELLLLVYGVTTKSQKEINANRIENRWLKKHGFMNDQLQLINDKGETVDREGRLINDDGEYVDKDGHRVDRFGNRIDKDGNPIFKDELEKIDAEEPKKESKRTKKKEEVVAIES